MLFKDKWPWFLLSFALFVSSLYEFGYWSVFGVNLFEYFQIQDVLKNFLFVVFNSTSPWWFALVAYTIISSADDKSVHWMSELETEKLGDGRVIVKPVSELNFYRKTILFIFNLPEITRMMVIFMMLVILFYYDGIENYPKLLVYALIFLIAFELTTNKAVNFLRSTKIMTRWAFWYFVLTVCWSALMSGREVGLDVINNKDFMYTTGLKDDSKRTDYPYVKYLGKAGEIFVFLSPDNKERILVQGDEAKTIYLRHLKKVVKRKPLF
jgi:hypothetical protein